MLAVLAALLACGCGKEREAAPAAPSPPRPSGPWSWQGPNAIDLSSPRGGGVGSSPAVDGTAARTADRARELAAFRARLADPASFAAGGGDGGSADGYTYDYFQLKESAWSRACSPPSCYEKKTESFFTRGDDDEGRRLAREELEAVAGEVIDHGCRGTFCGALRRLANGVLMEYGVDFSLPLAANPVCLRAVLCRRSDAATCYSIRKAYPPGFRPCSL